MSIRLAAFAAVLALASPALAEGEATGDQIRATITGNTVQGSMTASGAYTEFYAADGAIKGKDYAGTWTVEGDKMCFDYGDDPATCFGLRIAGDQVTWIGATGDEGTGTVLPGNPNNW
jgi:hypothetical protein